jgi:predicted hotdog family 3-hydroxylacyl-ACP dehydratase
MLLIDKIVNLSKDSAVSQAIPNDQWPLCNGSSVSPLLVIELVAQTSGLSNSFDRLNTENGKTSTKGWLVGIKKAVFHVHAIALGIIIVTEARNSFKFEGLCEIEGFCRIGEKVIGEVTLQVVRAD